MAPMISRQRWTLLVALLMTFLCVQEGYCIGGKVVTTQIGFATTDNKFGVLAVASTETPAQTFTVIDASGTVVWEDRLGEPVPGWIGSDATGTTYSLDFTGLNTPGTYRLVANGLTSHPFIIRDAIYDVRVNDGLTFFEIQNSSAYVNWTALDGFRGEHWPSHRDDARKGQRTDPAGGDRKLLEQPLPAGFPNHKDVSGGWYDAGDYNMYMGNTPWAVYNLLLAYEDSPGYWTPVDRDGNHYIDILEHALVALTWMSKMVWTDGSVFERVFNGYDAPFDGHPELETNGIPGDEDDRPLDSDRYADITAKSAYAFAVAARIFTATPNNFLDLAQRTWAWSYKNQATVKPQVYGGGRYFGDIDIGLTLGAIELIRSGVTQIAGVNLFDYAKGRITAHLDSRDWTNPSSWDYHSSYVLERFYELPNVDDTIKTLILGDLEAAYRLRIARQNSNPYGINDEWLLGAMRRRTGFGQNDLAVSSALDALWIYNRSNASDKAAFRAYALNQIQWVWGRNQFGESWLASDLATEFTRNMTWKATARHPINGVVVPGATDYNANGIPDYEDSGAYYYAEPTINQQAMYIRTLALMDRVTRNSPNPVLDYRPTVEITLPLDGQVVTSLVDISARASDDLGIAGVTWAIGNSAPVPMTYNTQTGVWAGKWDASNFPSNSYTITIVATDSAGQTAKNAVTVQVASAAQSVLQVQSLSVTLNEKGGARGQVQGKMDALIKDNSGNSISGAVVSGHWEGSANDSFSGATDSTGHFIDFSNAIKKSGAVSFRAVIENVSKDGWVFDKANSQTTASVSKTY